MTTTRRELFTTVRAEGGLLPADLLGRIVRHDKDVSGLTPGDYHLLPGEKLNEAINRGWGRLLGAWTSFRDAAGKLPAGEAATGLTRDRWLLPLFQELGYGRLQLAHLTLDGVAVPISHAYAATPIHLVGRGVGLDERSRGVAGAARSSPHSLIQDFLNRSDDHLWGVVSNGLRLRLLRDSKRLTRQTYVEFDLEAMLDGEVYADFVLLWLLLHQSRVEPAEERPERCWLERWAQEAQQRGTRALDGLRKGVEAAIAALGGGFLRHPANRQLRARLKGGELAKQDYYRQLLRLVYRLLFLFAAEDRDLLLDPAADAEARRRHVGPPPARHERPGPGEARVLHVQ